MSVVKGRTQPDWPRTECWGPGTLKQPVPCGLYLHVWATGLGT